MTVEPKASGSSKRNGVVQRGGRELPGLTLLVLAAGLLGFGAQSPLGAVGSLAGEPPRPAGQDPAPPNEETGQASPQDTVQEEGNADDELVPPGKRRAIAGVASVTGLSKVTFPGQPDVVQDLAFSYAFPDRARWRMSPAEKEVEGKVDGQPGKGSPLADAQSNKPRHQLYRYGNAVWVMPPGSTISTRLAGEELRVHLLRFELRRLALIWPGELEWSSEANSRRANLPELGQLHVDLDPTTGLPIAFRSLDPDGAVREEFKNITWNEPNEETGDRRTPAGWDLHFQGTHVWTEQFTFMKWGQRMSESYFQPFDKFKGGRLTATGDANHERFEIPRVSVWREEVTPAGKEDWDAAITQAKAALARWRPVLAEGGFVLDEWPVFRLNKEGIPTLLELQLKNLPDYEPEGWFTQGGIEGLRSVSVGLDKTDAAVIRRLRSRAPSGHVALDAYVKVQLREDGSVGITELVVPVVQVR